MRAAQQAVTSSVSPTHCVKAALRGELLPVLAFYMFVEAGGSSSATLHLPGAGTRSQSFLVLLSGRNGAGCPLGVEDLAS